MDTSVWSLAFRRDAPAEVPEVDGLRRALEEGDLVFTTGIVLQELLQGVRGPKARQRIIDHFSDLPLLVPDRSDHIEAAGIRTGCRRRGIQIGTIDALLARLCLHHDLTLLSADADFAHVSRLYPLTLWRG